MKQKILTSSIGGLLVLLTSLVVFGTNFLGSITEPDVRIIDDAEIHSFGYRAWNFRNTDSSNGFDGDASVGGLFQKNRSGAPIAMWTFDSVPSGEYQVFVHWVANTELTSEAKYVVWGVENDKEIDSHNQKVLTMNQKLRPKGPRFKDRNWQELTTVTLDTAGTIFVGLTFNPADSYASADAVMLRSIPKTESIVHKKNTKTRMPAHRDSADDTNAAHAPDTTQSRSQNSSRPAQATPSKNTSRQHTLWQGTRYTNYQDTSPIKTQNPATETPAFSSIASGSDSEHSATPQTITNSRRMSGASHPAASTVTERAQPVQQCTSGDIVTKTVRLRPVGMPVNVPERIRVTSGPPRNSTRSLSAVEALRQAEGSVSLLEEGTEYLYFSMSDLPQEADVLTHAKVHTSYNFQDDEVESALREMFIATSSLSQETVSRWRNGYLRVELSHQTVYGTRQASAHPEWYRKTIVFTVVDNNGSPLTKPIHIEEALQPFKGYGIHLNSIELELSYLTSAQDWAKVANYWQHLDDDPDEYDLSDYVSVEGTSGYIELGLTDLPADFKRVVSPGMLSIVSRSSANCTTCTMRPRIDMFPAARSLEEFPVRYASRGSNVFTCSKNGTTQEEGNRWKNNRYKCSVVENTRESLNNVRVHIQTDGLHDIGAVELDILYLSTDGTQKQFTLRPDSVLYFNGCLSKTIESQPLETVDESVNRLEIVNSGYSEREPSDRNFDVGEQRWLLVHAYKDDVYVETLNSQNFGLVFQSADPSILEISAQGQAKGIREGTTKVTVEYRGNSAEIEVEVQNGCFGKSGRWVQTSERGGNTFSQMCGGSGVVCARRCSSNGGGNVPITLNYANQYQQIYDCNSTTTSGVKYEAVFCR